jgi:four helix bundle protein
MDEWIGGWMKAKRDSCQVNKFMGQWINPCRRNAAMEYSKRRNLNRGYMKLDVWQRALDLFELAFRLSATVSDLKLRSQFRDAVQSVSANISEGYGRRSLPEYLQFLYIAKGSLGEAFTRTCGFWRAHLFADSDFEAFDTLHYEVENKLLHLISSLESKRGTNQWQDTLPTSSKVPSPIHPAPGKRGP